MIPLSQIDNHQNIALNTIEELGPVTIFIPNVSSLNSIQKQTLNEYLKNRITKDQPLIVSGLTTSLSDAIKYLGEELYKKTLYFFYSTRKKAMSFMLISPFLIYYLSRQSLIHDFMTTLSIR